LDWAQGCSPERIEAHFKEQQEAALAAAANKATGASDLTNEEYLTGSQVAQVVDSAVTKAVGALREENARQQQEIERQRIEDVHKRNLDALELDPTEMVLFRGAAENIAATSNLDLDKAYELVAGRLKPAKGAAAGTPGSTGKIAAHMKARRASSLGPGQKSGSPVSREGDGNEADVMAEGYADTWAAKEAAGHLQDL
jgi:hypothetical protein